MTPAAPLVSLCPPPKPRQAQSRVPTARPYSPSARPKWRGWGWWPSGAENPGAPRGIRGSWGRQWKPEVKRNTELSWEKADWGSTASEMTFTLSLKYYDLTLYENNLIYVLILHYIFFYIHLHRYWCMPVVSHRPKYNNCVCPQSPLYVNWKH